MNKEMISFENVLSAAVKIPGVKINRDEFLERELKKYCADDVVNKAVSGTPISAGVDSRTIEQIAKSCINYEALKVTGLSTIAGIPGGVAMIGTVPADLTQYLGHVLRSMQKIIYLYGWESLFNDSGEVDDGTKTILIILIGAVFGVQSAETLLNKIIPRIANSVEKKLLAAALTKTTVYPIVKKIAATIGVKMTKEVFAKGVAKAVPILGGITNGLLTLGTFEPMMHKFRKYIASHSDGVI